MTHSPAEKEAAWPIGTFCLMAVCIGMFILISLGRLPKPLTYIVVFGPDMQPGQWFSSLSIHVNAVQLAVCMVFLLVLGSIVEARIGLGWTIGLVIGLGATGPAIAQMALLDAKQDGVSLGTGTCLCGLVGLLALWSPITKVNRIGKIRLGNVSIPTWAILLTCLAVVLGIYSFMLGPFSLFPQAISLCAGAIMGAALLNMKIVEGDHQDLLTIMAGTAPGGRKERHKQMLLDRSQAEEMEQIQQQLTSAQDQLESYLGAGQFTAALALISKISHVGAGLQISSAQLATIIRGLHKQKKWEESIPWLQQYLERFPEDVAMRLKLAQIFLVEQRLPGSAMEVLKPLADRKLSESDEKLYRQLERAQFNMWEDDDIQLEVEKRGW